MFMTKEKFTPKQMPHQSFCIPFHSQASQYPVGKTQLIVAPQ